MSSITDAIQKYRTGAVDFSTLLEQLSRRQYPAPQRYKQRPQNPFMVEVTDPPVFEQGTWDEVRKARNLGLLTEKEYLQIAQAAWNDGQRPTSPEIVNRTKFIQHVAKASGLDEKQAKQAVDAVLDSITTALVAGEEVRLLGFGNFRVTETPARTGRHPRTGTAMNIAAGKRPKFKPGAHLKNAVAH